MQDACYFSSYKWPYCYRAYWSIICSLWRNKWAPQNTKAIYPICLWGGLFTNEQQEIIKQYPSYNLNENHDDDERDCINADDINDDDSSIDGDAEDSDEKDSQNSNNINNNIIHNKNATRLYSIAV